MKILFTIIVILLQGKLCFSQDTDFGLQTIQSDSLMTVVEKLCSIEFDGRLPGSKGHNLAAEYAAKKFAQLYLSPAGDDGYYQNLRVEYNKINSPVIFKIISEQGDTSYQHGKDFVPRGFTGSGNLTLPVVFCGYGISRPDLGYDDYDNIDVDGKIVMVFKQNPSWKINDSPWSNEYPREKSIVAYEHGAKGILFVSKPKDEKPQPLIGSVMHGEGKQPTDFPQLHISIEAADKLLSGTGVLINDCQNRIDENKKPFSINTRNKTEIYVQTEYEERANTMNVVGLLRGNDSELKEEYLVIGAHLDHVGSQAGLLFPGANDNASGSAGVLSLVEAFQKSNLIPKRSILFILFTGEEQGLLGSKYFVENLKIDTSKIIAMLNLDCIGYGDSIQVGNGKSSPALWQIADSIDQANSNLMVRDTWSGGGADATPFHEKGIPCLYFVSKYSYDHLHQPTDTPETLNPDLLESIVRLAYLTARDIADGNYERETVIR